MNIEVQIRSHHSRGEFDPAATLAIRNYGSEIFGFLVALHRSEVDARDVFSDVMVNLWKGMSSFRFACSIRSWLYVLARNASVNHRKRVARGKQRQAPSQEFAHVEAKLRTETRSYLKTHVRDRVARLRADLDPDDQTLLILRVDRMMSWNEIATILLQADDLVEGQAPDPKTVARRAAALRKRFERVKEHIRSRRSEGPPVVATVLGDEAKGG